MWCWRINLKGRFGRLKVETAAKAHKGFIICQHKTEPKNVEISTSISLEFFPV